MKTKDQGQLGENLARSFLENIGYQLIESNFVRRVGEIDLVMLAPPDPQHMHSAVVFVEVRYRTSADFGGALGSINLRKQRKMVRAANAWLPKNASSTLTARIDVITLEPLSAHTNGERSSLNNPLSPHEHSWQHHRLRWIPNAVEELT